MSSRKTKVINFDKYICVTYKEIDKLIFKELVKLVVNRKAKETSKKDYYYLKMGAIFMIRHNQTTSLKKL